jgi:hypothetical protein
MEINTSTSMNRTLNLTIPYILRSDAPSPSHDAGVHHQGQPDAILNIQSPLYTLTTLLIRPF